MGDDLEDRWRREDERIVVAVAVYKPDVWRLIRELVFPALFLDRLNRAIVAAMDGCEQLTGLARLLHARNALADVGIKGDQAERLLDELGEWARFGDEQRARRAVATLIERHGCLYAADRLPRLGRQFDDLACKGGLRRLVPDLREFTSDLEQRLAELESLTVERAAT